MVLSALFVLSCWNDEYVARNPLPRENQFIADKSRASAFTSPVRGNFAYWTPTQPEVDKALDGIYLSLWKSADGEHKKIYGAFKNYRVQIVGYMKGKRHVIFFNFFPAGESDLGWKERLVEVNDGGYGFWRCRFDVEAKEVFDIQINGYA